MLDGVNRFGTTSDMIIQEVELNGEKKLLAIDSKGLYLTEQSRVDKKHADVNRYGVTRQVFWDLLEENGFETFDLFEENKHLIKTVTAGKAKMVNPLKASKRGMK
ncbi:hypothetical protein [Desulfovibrio sp. JC010]|uniref:hypothetical protein n=1 Tax=Desulfovibrio sp. JC010 TaxID=2593641 RepID=UPI0013D06234|nr:hypothetical protein [Desulfovibrio sp. JC010]NDV28590.1 hypothetical protein [Desulfovibrio sp. JC010]